MAITPPPIPPNTGNPAQLEERADAFFGWFPTFVSDFNNELPLLRGNTWATRTGTANAITLTAGLVSLPVGTQVRFRAAAANTGAVTINLDGLGAVACRTITGVALPAGYIRTDVDTVATYDGSNWVLDRDIERAGNANGGYVRFPDGTQICFSAASEMVGNTLTQVNALFRSDRLAVSTFPAAFSATPSVSASATTPSTQALWVSRIPSISNVDMSVDFLCAAGLSSVTFRYAWQAIGRWY